jgi:NADPH:quinone reductase
MKAVLVRKFGPPEVLVAEELPDPRPGDGQVVVEDAAVGVNFIEKTVRAGAFARAGNGIGRAVELIERE